MSPGTPAKIEAQVWCVNDALFVLARVLKTEPGVLFPRDVAVIISALVR